MPQGFRYTGRRFLGVERGNRTGWLRNQAPVSAAALHDEQQFGLVLKYRDVL